MKRHRNSPEQVSDREIRAAPDRLVDSFVLTSSAATHWAVCMSRAEG
jgi:hypothetical protein